MLGSRPALVDPNAVRRVELAVFFAGFAEGFFVVGFVVVQMDDVGAVAIRQIEVSAIGAKGNVGWLEVIAGHAGLRAVVFPLGIDAGLDRGVSFPDRLAFERELGKLFEALVAGDVEELFAIFLVHFEAVAAALEFLAEGADVFALGIEHENGGVVLLILVAFVDHIQIAGFVERHVVRSLPGELVGQLRPIVFDFVLVLALAQDDG